ncbi:unnamed protein product, partial [Laminaria digitata]
ISSTVSPYDICSQEDIDTGSVSNSATVKGWCPPPGSVEVTGQDGDIVDLPQKMEILVNRTLESISTIGGLNSAVSDEGDVARFKVTITNIGNTALSAVVLTDTAAVVAADVGGIHCDQDFSAASSNFLPDSHPSGAAIVCTVDTLLTGSHIDAGGFKGTSKV